MSSNLSSKETRPTDPNDPLFQYWKTPVAELARVENTRIPDQIAERHTILSLLAMALVSDAWNGNKRGQWGDYPWRSSQRLRRGLYAGDRYLGHNIACLAVDDRGEIIEFEFNHNEIFNSSAEHAEARLVRRIFNLNQNYDHWQTRDHTQIVDVPYANVLSAVTVYTTLESCVQCSGIMTLGNVKSVVFLQSDPGQYRIGNILYNLSNPRGISHPSTLMPGQKPPQKYGAPEPVNADIFEFPYKSALDQAYATYATGVQSKYFWLSPNKATKDSSNSITSFLCTDQAKEIFDRAAAHLTRFKLKFPRYAPVTSGPQAAMNNKDLLGHANRFRDYVKTVGRRGTPHR